MLKACIQGGVYIIKSIYKLLSIPGSGFLAFIAINQISVFDIAYPAQDETLNLNTQTQDTEYQL